MKILFINGSPKKNGNTATALRAIRKGVDSKHSSVWVDAADFDFRGCVACDGCKRNGGRCVQPDGGTAFIDQVAAADMIVFGSPVYWWGVSAQLKAGLDRFYSKDEAFHQAKKIIASVAVGAGELADPEYRLIAEQFQCIADFLGWRVAFAESISAAAHDELAKNAAELARLEKLGAAL